MRRSATTASPKSGSALCGQVAYQGRGTAAGGLRGEVASIVTEGLNNAGRGLQGQSEIGTGSGHAGVAGATLDVGSYLAG